MTSLEIPSIPDLRDTVALACRVHGKQRGWAIASRLLGIAERTARAISYGETSGATVDPITALEARNTLRRARAEQLRAELRELEQQHVETCPGGGAPVGSHR